ncbi:hypothetical protein, partial [Pseudomonas viridiflava]|uniref:hypothetical protein n=1 Tax=Pseudomonas viridiflava TaxID=33069 RepID=UPI001981A93F
ETHPAVHDDGREDDHLRLSLTELALVSFDSRHYTALSKSTLEDKPLSDTAPALKAQGMFNLIADAPWTRDYAVALRHSGRGTRKTTGYCPDSA